MENKFSVEKAKSKSAKKYLYQIQNEFLKLNLKNNEKIKIKIIFLYSKTRNEFYWSSEIFIGVQRLTSASVVENKFQVQTVKRK